MRLHHISADNVVFLYDHSSGDCPRVGNNYLVTEVGTEEGLIVQIVALETFNYPSLSEVLMRQLMEDAYGPGQVQTFAGIDNAPQIENLGQATGKIRRRQMADGSWGIWNGYLPSRNVTVTRVPDADLFRNCGLDNPKHPLSLGTTLDGANLAIAGRSFEKINIITALKGMGKSHLAKVLILELIRHEMVSVVFDVNREYNGLPVLQYDNQPYSALNGIADLSNPTMVTRGGTLVLSAGQNFRFTIVGFGRQAFIRLFETFSPQEPTRNMFETRVTAHFEGLDQIDLANIGVDPEQQRRPPFTNLETIRGLFPQRTTGEHIRSAIMDRLETMDGLNLFAENEQQGSSFDHAYNLCAQRGGAIVVDLARLSSRFGREVFVGATLDMVQRMARTHAKLPFVFFEEAHLYASGERIENLVTRARHLGITSTFVTNMVTQLNETVLRQVDNLFLLYLPYKDDVRHVAKSATTDEETVSAFAQRIERHHAMIVGPATNNYPIVFRVASPDGINMAGATRYAFSE